MWSAWDVTGLCGFAVAASTPVTVTAPSFTAALVIDDVLVDEFVLLLLTVILMLLSD